MTFFANSGISFPNLDQQTQNAGTDSLKAGSRIFDLIATLENGDDTNYDVEEIINYLNNAASTYQKIATELDGSFAKEPTFAELELIGLNYPFYSDFPSKSLRYRRYRYGEEINVGDLYLELSHLISFLSSTIQTLDLNQNKSTLQPQIFRIMIQWENANALARMIALINNRVRVKQ